MITFVPPEARRSYPWWPEDGRSMMNDPEYLMLDAAASGVLARLRYVLWAQGKVSSDPRRIAVLIRLPDDAVSLALQQLLAAGLLAHTQDQNDVYCPKLESMMVDLCLKNRQAQEAGKRGAEIKKLQKLVDAGTATKGQLARLAALKAGEEGNEVAVPRGALGGLQAPSSLLSLSSPSGSPSNSDLPSAAVPPCPFDAIVDLYHAELPELPRVIKLLDPHKAEMKARWEEAWNEGRSQCFDDWETAEDGLSFFRDFFRQVAESPFLLGLEGDGTFRADLEWLMMERNFLKVREGKWRHSSPA